jgi:hypothetical protein
MKEILRRFLLWILNDGSVAETAPADIDKVAKALQTAGK